MYFPFGCGWLYYDFFPIEVENLRLGPINLTYFKIVFKYWFLSRWLMNQITCLVHNIQTTFYYIMLGYVKTIRTGRSDKCITSCHSCENKTLVPTTCDHPNPLTGNVPTDWLRNGRQGLTTDHNIKTKTSLDSLTCGNVISKYYLNSPQAFNRWPCKTRKTNQGYCLN